MSDFSFAQEFPHIEWTVNAGIVWKTAFYGDPQCGCGEAPEKRRKKKTLEEERLLLLRSSKVNTTTAMLGCKEWLGMGMLWFTPQRISEETVRW